jgi:hypothetical protein
LYRKQHQQSSVVILPAFLNEFAKLRKVNISFVMSAGLSIRPFARVEHLGSHWTDFDEIRYLRFFSKLF